VPNSRRAGRLARHSGEAQGLVVAVNDAGEILMIRRTDNANWAAPGGAVDLGESAVQTAVRESVEESGIDYAVTGMVGTYPDPGHVILYTSNGEAGLRSSPSCLRQATARTANAQQ
jgi:8-oxo-dGTP pyrophosphatase MutT (NUDIX family)